MKRTEEKKEKKNQRPWWIKTSPGTLIRKLPLKFRIKTKEKIQASVEELGTNLKTGKLYCETDFKVLEEGTGKYAIKKSKKDIEKKKETGDTNEEYTVKSVGKGWYNVLSPSGEICNDKKLHAEKAEELRKQLESVKDE